MPIKTKVQQFVVLPPRGVRLAKPTASPTLGTFLRSFPHADGLAAPKSFKVAAMAGPQMQLKVLDAIAEDGAKLVEMSLETCSALRAQEPGLRIVPVRYFHPAVPPRPRPRSSPSTAAASVAVRIVLKVVSKSDGSPVAGANVVAFTDFAQRIGVQGRTNAQGEVSLAMGASSKKLERLYVFAPVNFWSALKRNVTVSSGTEIPVRPLDLGFVDGLRHFYGNSPDGTGQNVRVGVVDTGVGPHPDLLVEDGANTVLGEVETDFGDNGDGHGTHVAGIIAARGVPPQGVRGLAPGVALRSYRVFGRGEDGASSFAIAKAIDRAVQDGCDLVNMSLGGGDEDDAIKAAIADARAQGSVVIVAAGNDDRSPVAFPASSSLSIAVSAMGRKGTFPSGTPEAGEVAKPFGDPDGKNFMAAFSNIGPEIDLTGPGVGMISTFPGGYAPLYGTSMACPAVTGMAAKLLAPLPQVLSMSRDAARSDAMAKVILQSARSLGFSAIFEGRGIL